MKKLTIAAVLAAQLLSTAQPALAADLTDTQAQRMGAFAGFRVRVHLDGEAGNPPVRAALTVAPTSRRRTEAAKSAPASAKGSSLGSPAISRFGSDLPGRLFHALRRDRPDRTVSAPASRRSPGSLSGSGSSPFRFLPFTACVEAVRSAASTTTEDGGDSLTFRYSRARLQPRRANG